MSRYLHSQFEWVRKTLEQLYQASVIEIRDSECVRTWVCNDDGSFSLLWSFEQGKRKKRKGRGGSTSLDENLRN